MLHFPGSLVEYPRWDNYYEMLSEIEEEAGVNQGLEISPMQSAITSGSDPKDMVTQLATKTTNTVLEKTLLNKSQSVASSSESSENLDELLDAALDLFDETPSPMLDQSQPNHQPVVTSTNSARDVSLPEFCFIGTGNIDQEIVDKAVSSIQQTCLILFSRMIKENEKRMDFQAFECLTRRALNEYEGRIKIKNEDGVSLASEERYSISVGINIKDIDESSPAGLLVSQLSKRVAQLGFPCSELDLRFEQGCLESLTPYWHFDPKVSPWTRGSVHSIITSYSNKTNWNTRILKPIHNNKFALEGRDRLPTNETVVNEVEQLSESAQFGCLYDGQRVLHRSPIEKDLEGNLTKNDYRLFIRFFQKA